MKRCQLSVWLFASLIVLSVAHDCSAQWSVGVRIGAPLYRPHYHHYGHYHYHGLPYYYAPPVVYAPPPVVYAPAPIVVRQPPYDSQYAPAPSVVPVPSSNASQSAPVVPVRNDTTVSNQAEGLLTRLKDSADTVRRDAAMDLGRMKSQQSIDALIATMSKDPSPIVRDAAARGLGLIASPRSLSALIYAAQADADRDVRHSAQFAVEIIRTNMRGN